MDTDRFDRLLRSLTETPSRRVALRLLVGSALGSLLGGAAVQETAAHDLLTKCKTIKNGRRKQRCVKQGKKHNVQHAKESVGILLPPRVSPPPPPPRPPDSCNPPNPPCGPGQGCVYGTCVSLSGGCGATTNNTFCAEVLDGPNGASQCPDRVGSTDGTCTLADDGPFCAGSVICTTNGTDACQSHADCVNEGYGANVRCVQECNDICGPGASGCVKFYLDPENTGCVPYGFPCTGSPVCCNNVPCTGNNESQNFSCRYS